MFFCMFPIRSYDIDPLKKLIMWVAPGPLGRLGRDPKMKRSHSIRLSIGDIVHEGKDYHLVMTNIAMENPS